MKFSTKMSGVRVDDWTTADLSDFITEKTGSSYHRILPVWAIAKFCKQEVLEFVIKHYRLMPFGNETCICLDMDDDTKLGILQMNPTETQELIDNIGANWLEYYLRFGH